MKKSIKTLLVVAVSLIVIILCITAYVIPSKKPSIYSNPIHNIEDTAKNSYKLPNGEILPIDEKDFAITDGEEIIVLDTPYKYYSTKYPEIKQDDNFYTDVTVEDITYTYYIHKYQNFNLFVSNPNYQAKNRSPEDQYIAMLVIKDAPFKTRRGIKVGSNAYEIEEAYGKIGKYSNAGKNSSYKITYKDMELYFKLNEENWVQEITMRVLITPPSLADKRPEKTKRD